MAFNDGDTFKHVFKVLFVCSDNLCRSPVAQAVFEKKSALAQLDSFFCSDSAGMNVIESGKTPDSRSQHAAAFHGYRMLGQMSRQVSLDDFEQFDLILAMDWQSLRALQKRAPENSRYKIELIMRYAQNFEDAEVPDPLNQNQRAFSLVVEYLEDAITGLVDVLKRRVTQNNAA